MRWELRLGQKELRKIGHMRLNQVNLSQDWVKL
jgi:hypothetical protein